MRESIPQQGKATREERGILLFRERGEEIVRFVDGTFGVAGSDGETVYRVDLEEETCGCPDHKRIGQGFWCKHMFSARLKLAEIRNRERANKERCGCVLKNGLTHRWCDGHWRENEKRQAEMRARALRRNAERAKFSPAQVFSNLDRMGA